MPRILAEDPTPVYVLLGLTSLVLLALLWSTRQGKYAVGIGVAVFLAFLVWLLDFLIVTDHEHMVLNVQTMARSVAARDLDSVFGHISEDFLYHDRDKQAFRKTAESVLNTWDIRDIKVWDFQSEEASRSSRQGRLVFKVKVKEAGGEGFYRCRTEFILDPDGRWRLKGFKLYNPFVETEQEITIPF